MKKIFIALAVLSTLTFAKIDVIEAISMNVQAMQKTDKVSIQKVCIDGFLYIMAVSSAGISITKAHTDNYNHSCVNGK